MKSESYLYGLVELCVQKGVRQAIISPGSRSAPLTLALARHPLMQSRVVIDERSAGFIALGIAQQIRQPVILVCTSGSAVYNLAPAVAEAYFQEIPLIILTADRPKEWVQQQDGQTIFQTGIYGNHVKRSFELPADVIHPDTEWFVQRLTNEAIDLARTGPRGPVHINLPFREPLYPADGERMLPGRIRLIEQLPVSYDLSTETWHRLQEEWDASDRILVAVGQHSPDPALARILRTLGEEWSVPIIGDVIANLPREGSFLSRHDLFLPGADEALRQRLTPDLLITCGQSFLSKALKQFLRNNPARRHWHIQEHDRLSDPFQSLTTLIRMEPAPFFEKLFSDIDYQRFVGREEEPAGDDYYRDWQTEELKASRSLHPFLQIDTVFHEWAVVYRILDALPGGGQLHVANSMPIRYVNMTGLRSRLTDFRLEGPGLEGPGLEGPGLEVAVFANRGTSGIDGCLSTAVGAALTTTDLVTVLIGDAAFFYDRNALWNDHLPANLRIIVLNNHGGNIFRIIDGPARQPELETYFEAAQPMKAENTARDAGLEYTFCRTYEALQSALSTFFLPGEKPRLLEIETDRKINAQQFRAYKAGNR